MGLLLRHRLAGRGSGVLESLELPGAAQTVPQELILLGNPLLLFASPSKLLLLLEKGGKKCIKINYKLKFRFLGFEIASGSHWTEWAGRGGVSGSLTLKWHT